MYTPRRSIEELTVEVTDKFPDLRKISTSQKERKVTWKCRAHGLFTSKLIVTIKSKHGCPKCGREEQLKASAEAKHKLRATNDRVRIELIKSKHKNIKILSDSKFHCKTCAQDFNSTLRRVSTKFENGCPRCGQENSYIKGDVTRALKSKSTTKRFEKLVKAKLKDYSTLSYHGIAGRKFKIKCTVCKTKTLRYASALLSMPDHTTGCKSCSAKTNAELAFSSNLKYHKLRLKTRRLTFSTLPSQVSSSCTLTCLECSSKFPIDNFMSFISSQKKCKECYPESWIVKGSRTYSMRVPKVVVRQGKTFNLTGHEDLALDIILNTMPRVTAKDIEACPVARSEAKHIEYKVFSRVRKHYPDFWINKHNLFVEVKSVYTFGIPKVRQGDYGTTDTLTVTAAKAKAAHAQGYKYRVLIHHTRGRYVLLPEMWYDLSTKQLGDLIKRKLA